MLKLIKNLIRKVPFIESWDDRRIQNKYMSMTYDEIEQIINKYYLEIFGRKINWDDPKSYNEKLQVSKLYDVAPFKTHLSDKYKVRRWIKWKIGEEYLIPLIGVYDSFDEIKFKDLPDQFVIKCNHDSGSVIFCRDKNNFDIDSARKKINSAMRKNYAYPSFEMYYKNIPPKILIEKYMGDNISDYKFLCFDGKPYYCQVIFNRYSDEKMNFYDMNWELQNFKRPGFENYNSPVDCPDKFEDMKKICCSLCKNLDHVRVDLYLIEKKIYFGEMTFTAAGGFRRFDPDEWDFKLGALWKFDNTIRQKVREKNLKP